MYDKLLEKIKMPPKKTMRKKQSNSKCDSITKDVSVVKTSIFKPKSFIDLVWRKNLANTVVKNRCIQDSREYQMRMHSAVLLRDPFYICFIYSLLFYYDLNKIKSFKYHLIDDYNYLSNETQSESSEYLKFLIFQLSIHFECITQNDENSDKLDNFYFSPNFYQFDNFNIFEPEPQEITISPLVTPDSLFTMENALLLMKKIFLGVDPSKPDGEYIDCHGSIEMLVAYLTGCYFTNKLNIPIAKCKCPRYEDEKRPLIYSFIKNHIRFIKPINKTTVYRNCEDVYDYFSVIDELKASENDKLKNEFVNLLENTSPNDYGIPFRESRYKNIISACNCIPE